MKSRISKLIPILLCFLAGLPSLASAAEIWSSDPSERHHYIATVPLADGRVRFEFRDAGQKSGIVLGSPAGYTEAELRNKARRLKINAAATGLFDAALVAGAAGACVAGGTMFVMLLTEGSTAAYGTAWVGGAAAGGAGMAKLASATDALNPMLKLRAANTLEAATCRQSLQVEGSIFRLQRRLDQALREVSEKPERAASNKVKISSPVFGHYASARSAPKIADAAR